MCRHEYTQNTKKYKRETGWIVLAPDGTLGGFVEKFAESPRVYLCHIAFFMSSW